MHRKWNMLHTANLDSLICAAARGCLVRHVCPGTLLYHQWIWKGSKAKGCCPVGAKHFVFLPLVFFLNQSITLQTQCNTVGDIRLVLILQSPECALLSSPVLSSPLLSLWLFWGFSWDEQSTLWIDPLSISFFCPLYNKTVSTSRPSWESCRQERSLLSVHEQKELSHGRLHSPCCRTGVPNELRDGQKHNRVEEPDLGIRHLTNCVTRHCWALSQTGNMALDIKWALGLWKGQAAVQTASGNHAARCNQLACCLKQKLWETCMLKKRQIELLKSQKHICSLCKQDEFIKGIWLQEMVHITIRLLYLYVTPFRLSYSRRFLTLTDRGCFLW